MSILCNVSNEDVTLPHKPKYIKRIHLTRVKPSNSSKRICELHKLHPLGVPGTHGITDMGNNWVALVCNGRSLTLALFRMGV